MKKTAVLTLALIMVLQTVAYAEGNITFSGIISDGAKSYVSALVVKKEADANHLTKDDICWVAQSTVEDNGSYSITVPMELLTEEYNLLSNVKLKNPAYSEYIYVSEKETSETSDGTRERPYRTVRDALKAAKRGDTIVLKDIITFTSQSLTCSDGAVVITGRDPETGEINGGIDFAANKANVATASDITFENMTLKTYDKSEPTRLYAYGHKLVMGEGLVMTNPINVYGGASGSQNVIKNTDITLISGTYNTICGGGINSAVTGDTCVTIKGCINAQYSAYDTDSNKYDLRVYGGGTGTNATVGGSTYVNVCDGNIMYVFGAGSKNIVEGDTHVNITGGNVMNVYGGSSGEATIKSNSYINMTGGTVEAIFGGSNSVDFNGNTNVKITGGKVLRRIYGGCYNDYGLFGYSTSAGVTGTSSVSIGKGAELPSKTSKYGNVGIFASDRYSNRKSGADAVLIFLDGCYENFKDKIGEQVSSSSTFKSNHNYIVKAGEGGAVKCLGNGKIVVNPDSGKTAVINGENFVGETYKLSMTETSIEFTDNEFSIESANYMVNGDNVDIDASVKAGTGFSIGENYVIVAAAYDEEDRMINSQILSLTDDKDYKFNLNLSDSKNSIYNIRLFAWNKENLKPLTRAFVLRVN